jgi:hypothetical protein
MAREEGDLFAGRSGQVRSAKRETGVNQVRNLLADHRMHAGQVSHLTGQPSPDVMYYRCDVLQM